VQLLILMSALLVLIHAALMGLVIKSKANAYAMMVGLVQLALQPLAQAIVEAMVPVLQ